MKILRGERFVLTLSFVLAILGARVVVSQCSSTKILGPAGNSRFAASISVDGTRLLVDARRSNSALLYRNDETGAWVREHSFSRGRGVGNSSVSGDTVLIGGRDAAPVVYRLRDGTWVQEGRLEVAGRQGSYGQVTALDGDLALVAEFDRSRVHIFHRTGTRWGLEETLVGTDLFGWGIAVDGDLAAVGVPRTDDLGEVILYRRVVDGEAVSWEEEARLLASDGCRPIGRGLAVSGDVVVAGSAPDFAAVGCGRAYVFRRGDSGWVEEQIIEGDPFSGTRRAGSAVAVLGDRLIVGEPAQIDYNSDGRGAAYVYRYDGEEWVLTSRTDAPDASDDWYGYSVGVFPSGAVAIGAVFDDEAAGDAGAVYIEVAGPEAVMSVSATELVAGGEVAVDALESRMAEGGPIVSYLWRFGDGTEATGAEARHVYAEPGRYELSLRVTDESGLCGTATQLVLVTCPTAELSSWTAADVGEASFAGSTVHGSEVDENDLVLCAGGTGFSGARDNFHFAYREEEGEAYWTARISDLEYSEYRSSVGLMIRESLDPSARFAAVFVQAQVSASSELGRFSFRYRQTQGGFGRARNGDQFESDEVWLQLRRAGQEVIGLGSLDGKSWTEIARQTLDFTGEVHVGVFASGADSPNLTSYRALSARARVTREDPPSPSFRRADTDVNSVVDMSDAVATLQFLFLGGQAPSCEKAADSDDSGVLDLSDGVLTLNYLFLGGPPPSAPFPGCGEDPTEDELSCDEYAPLSCESV